MPAAKNVGEPCAGEPHARLDVAVEETRPVGYTVRPRHLPPALPDPSQRHSGKRGWARAGLQGALVGKIAGLRYQ
jgi:hypothetical protein